MLVYIILAVYAIITVGIGVYFNRKSKTVSDFVLGGRAVGPWITAFSYGTSYFSAVVFVGYAGQFGWKYGLAAFWIGIGNAVIGSLAVWATLGRRTRVMTKHLDSSTMPDFFAKRYDSKPIKLISAGIVFVFLIPYTASVYNGLSRLFSVTFALPYEACVIGMAVITAVYVILGGYKATAYNDLFQGVIMIGGIIAVIASVLGSHGGFGQAMVKLSEVEGAQGSLSGMSGAFTSIFGPDPANLIGVVILTSLGAWGLPQMTHKFYTIRDDKSIRAGMIVSTFFALIVAGGCYFLGGFGRITVEADAAGLPAGGYDDIIPTMLQSLPEILIGIVIVLVLSASMSTLSALVLTSSSTLTLDLIKPMLEKRAALPEKRTLLIMRVFIGVFLLISVLIALNKNTLISDLMGYSWGALAGSFLAPYMYGLFWKKTTRAAVYTSFAFGVGATLFHFLAKPQVVLFGFNLASPVNVGALVMIVPLILVPVVSLLTPKMEKSHLTEVFSCFDKN